jgi:uncharacterized protein (DUF885 family)
LPADADSAFGALARAILDGLAERRPEWATEAGDHRHDGRLTVGTAAYHAETAAWAGKQLTALAAVDTGALSPQNRVDAQLLANHLTLLQFTAEELREPEWNPLLANPGQALYLLLARDFAPLPERLRSAASRLAALPEALAAARAVLGQMPRVHLQTALGQFAGTEQLIRNQLAPLAQDENGAARELGAAVLPALEALGEHLRWLEQQLADGDREGFRDPRLGPDLYARKLRLVLDTDLGPDELLARAEAELARAGEELEAAATAFLGAAATASPVEQALARQAGDVLDDSTVLEFARRVLGGLRDFVTDRDMVTVHDDPVQVIEMPEIDRGGAIAYCDGPGPLEPLSLPTFIAVAPAPAGWPPERVQSYYRENNKHLIHDMFGHEGYPGHAVQFGHNRRFAGATPVRAALWSRSFSEGWGVYAERLLCDHGYQGEGNPAGFRLQRQKNYLKAIINAVLDVRVHCAGLTEADAKALMTGPGFQEDGEAAVKWRRLLLTSASLTTYYVGFTEISDLASSLRAAHPGWPDRQLHDAMLAHGTAPVRHVRTLLDI